MWVCNLCRKQQEILTKSGAWFYGSGPGQVRGVFEGGPQGKKAKLQDPSLYPYQGTSGDLTPASDRSRLHTRLLPRQASLDNGPELRYPGPADVATDRSAGEKTHMGLFFCLCTKSPTVKLLCTTMSTWGLHHLSSSKSISVSAVQLTRTQPNTRRYGCYQGSHSICNIDQMHLYKRQKNLKRKVTHKPPANGFFLHLNTAEVVGERLGMTDLTDTSSTTNLKHVLEASFFSI